MPDREFVPGDFVWVKGPWEQATVCGRVLARRDAEYHVAWADTAGGLMEKAFSPDELTLAKALGTFVFASDPEPEVPAFVEPQPQPEPEPLARRRGRK